MSHPFHRRDWFIVLSCALVASFVAVYTLVPRPTYLDSYYHFSAAARLASGAGLTDTYLWIYLGLPPDLAQPITETPSHLYWMPMTSLISGAFMTVFGVAFAIAQIPMALCLTGAILIAALAGGWIGGEKRHAVLAAILAVASGSFIDFWGEIDTFAPYALFGSGALACIILARESGRTKWWLIAGLFCGAGHLTRSDGLLLLIVGVAAWATAGQKRRWAGLVLLVAGYLAVMGPWFARMNQIVGAPLPLGGLQTAYLTDYVQIFRYPWQDLSIGSAGLDALIQARVDALGGNLGTFFVSEGWLVLWPLMLWGLYRSPSPVRFTVALFALGLHAAMILVFAWPGARGGLFHGAAALMPFWAAMAIKGADSLARLISRVRPRALPLTRWVIAGLVLGSGVMMTTFSLTPSKTTTEPGSITALRPILRPDDRVMATDPGKIYYYLNVGGVVLPDSPVDLLPAMAETFDLDYLLLEEIETKEDGTLSATAPEQLNAILTEIPPFLELVEDFGHMRLYRFIR